ncbi:MAG: YncE family protein [Saprospiraceae bacterium]
MKIVLAFGLFLCGSLLCSVRAQSGSTYNIVNRIHLEGDEKWDFLFSDNAAGRLYVSHGNMVQIVDEKKGIELGRIVDLQGVHGIAIAPEWNKGFISTKDDNSVVVFDTKTFKTIKKIAVPGKSPDAILYEPFSKKIFVFNGHSNNATVLDPNTGTFVDSISFSGNPEVAVSDGKGKIYVNLEDASSIAVINVTTYKVEHVWPIAPGQEPTGLAFDNETHRLFSVCANKLMVVTNAESGKVVTTLPIGAKPDGAAFDNTLKRAYSTNGEGTLTVVQEKPGDSYSVMETVTTQKGAKTITLNQLTHHVFSSTADYELAVGDAKPKLKSGSFMVLDIAPGKM